MPFIITTTSPNGSFHGEITSHAVGTIEEARDYVLEDIGISEPDTWAEHDAIQASIDNLPESGGTIGPLPDGTTIEVSLATYDDLRASANLVGIELYGLRDERRDQILDAYNTRQEG